MDEIKPCPFCGSEPRLKGGRASCWTRNCPAVGGPVDVWNRRTPTPASAPAAAGTARIVSGGETRPVSDFHKMSAAEYAAVGHDYGNFTGSLTWCGHHCGAWASGWNSGGPAGIDPLGACPRNPGAAAGTGEVDQPECPGEDCLMCSGEACDKCGAGCWNNQAPFCEHDTTERHEYGGATPTPPPGEPK